MRPKPPPSLRSGTSRLWRRTRSVVSGTWPSQGSPMLNRRNGFKLAVHAPLGAGPYVLVPREQVDQVRYLLITNGIGHTVDDWLSGRDRPRDEQVIHVGTMWDLDRVQDVLDSAE